MRNTSGLQRGRQFPDDVANMRFVVNHPKEDDRTAAHQFFRQMLEKTPIEFLKIKRVYEADRKKHLRERSRKAKEEPVDLMEEFR